MKKKKEADGVCIQNCNFTGVKYEIEGEVLDLMSGLVSAAEETALALCTNAKTLEKVASVLTASNIKIEALLKIGGRENAIPKTNLP